MISAIASEKRRQIGECYHFLEAQQRSREIAVVVLEAWEVVALVLDRLQRLAHNLGEVRCEENGIALQLREDNTSARESGTGVIPGGRARRESDLGVSAGSAQLDKRH